MTNTIQNILDRRAPWVLAVLGKLRDMSTLLLFSPFFGLSGTHFQEGGQKRKGLRDWMAYNLRHRRLLIQTHKGRTAINYTVYGVGPLTYLRLLDDNDFSRVIESGSYGFETVWRWAWDGRVTQPKLGRIRAA